MKRILSALLVITVLFIVACDQPKTDEKPKMSEEEILATAKQIHEEVITLDTHDDIDTENFTDDQNYTKDLDSQVTLPKMKKGGLDVAWFIVYTGQGELNEEGYKKAYENAIDKFDAIDRLVTKYAPEQIELAKTSDDVRRIHKSGKLVAMIGVENAYPIGTDLSNIKKFADRGARYMSLAHNGHSQLADSNTEEKPEKPDKPIHNGLSELGKKAVAEMNKWGIMVDISHPSKSAIKQMIELSKAPVIASHSSARALADHSRNLSDEQLEMVKNNGGVVQTVALNSYLNVEKAKKRQDAAQEIFKGHAKKEGLTVYESRDEAREKLSEKELEEYFEKVSALRKKIEDEVNEKLKETAPPVNVKDFVDHIDYMVKKMGIDHVGISSDFDGGGGIEGWKDASETLNVTIELVRRGYTKEQIEKIWSGNLLRVLDEVQKVAKELQSESA
ncbi:MAG: dipeptidase [Acidobacteriota bacterium]|nr:dipeptidase [Acidobacteriota bacterium]MDH3528433.1 dipeptidase [Acidobacteriota bacterium]